MSTKKQVTNNTNNTNLLQCGAPKKNGEQCSAKCTTGSLVCRFHKDVKPTFPSTVLESCSATTQKGAPCKNAVVRNGLCGTHSRDPTKPRKPSSRVGMLTTNNVFTSRYWAGRPKGTGSAQECARLWAEAKSSKTKLFQECETEANSHNKATSTA